MLLLTFLFSFFSYRCCYHPSSRFLLVLSSCVVPVPCYVCLCIPLLSKFFVFSSFFLLRFHCYRFDCADFGGASSYSLIIFISSLCYQLLFSAPSDCAVLLAFSSSIWLFVYCIFFVFFPFQLNVFLIFSNELYLIDQRVFPNVILIGNRF